MIFIVDGAEAVISFVMRSTIHVSTVDTERRWILRRPRHRARDCRLQGALGSFQCLRRFTQNLYPQSNQALRRVRRSYLPHVPPLVTRRGSWGCQSPLSGRINRNKKRNTEELSERKERTNTKWTSKRTCYPYVPPPTAHLQPDDICNEEFSDDTERKAATCPDLRTSTEKEQQAWRLTKSGWTRTLRTHAFDRDSCASAVSRLSSLSCVHVPCCA